MDNIESFIDELKKYVDIQPVTDILEKEKNHKFSFNGCIFFVDDPDEDHFSVYPFTQNGSHVRDKIEIGFERNRPEKQKEAMWFFNKYAVCGKDDGDDDVAVDLTPVNADKLKKTLVKAIEKYNAFPGNIQK